MDDLDAALAAMPIAAPTLAGAVTPRKHRHVWLTIQMDVTPLPTYANTVHKYADTGNRICRICGAIRDETRSRRGKSSRRLGGDQERRIERRYGPRKIGEYGDAVDHIGRDWKWQSKATRADPPLWLAKIAQPTYFAKLPLSIIRPLDGMTGIYLDHRPVVIRSYVRNGTPTRDWLFISFRVEAEGDLLSGGYMVYPGSVWLDTFGRDEPND